MFEIVALVLFVAFPFLLGYVSGSYVSVLLPAASLVASVASYAVRSAAGDG